MSATQREFGRRAILTEIRRAGQIPRIELAQRTGISRATVTTITAELLQEGLIQESPRTELDGDATRGRPRVDLRLRGAARLVAGAKVSGRSISLVLLDFEGEQRAAHETRLSASALDTGDMVAALDTALTGLMQEAGQDPGDLAGVCIGIAGIVDAAHGFVHWSPSLTARNIDLGAELSAKLGIPAFIDNDANLVAVAEKTFGLGRPHSDFIVVTIESGVGLGLVLGDRLYRGTRGCGAEFGHTKVQIDGALCRCGQRGCLEAYISDYALLREASFTLGRDLQIGELLQQAKAGEPIARSVVDRAGRMFALGLANLVNIFDPELIILAGEQMQFDHLYAPEVIEMMRKSIVQVDKPPPEVVIHKWGNLMWARGAAAHALDKIEDRALQEIGDHAA